MTSLLYEWMGASYLLDGAAVSGPVTQAPGGPFAAGSTPQYRGQLFDAFGAPIPAANLSALTLSIVDALTGAVVNGVSAVNILNTGRGTVDAQGNLVVSLLAADTSTGEVPGASQVWRSLVLDWTYTQSAVTGSGRHQANFSVVALSGP